MAAQKNLLTSPLFRYGTAAMTTAVIVTIAFLYVESDRLRTLMFVVAALDFIVTPQILKRAGQQAAM